MAIPSYAGLRLWPDIAHTLSVGVPERPAASDQHRKRRVAFGALEAPIPVPLKALYVLVPPLSPQPDTILLERVTPADGLIELVRHAFRLDVTDRSMLAQQFRYFGRLTLETPIFRLNYPREYSALPAVRAAIFQSIVPKNG
jgi:hypothetical protein